MTKLTRRSFLRSTGTLAIGALAINDTLSKTIESILPPPPTPAGGQPTSAGSILSLPKGGGAVKGIGETFQPNPYTGTGNFSVPIFTSPGRGGLTPQLSIGYSTGIGNGPFGQGWNLSIPMVCRKTEKGIPKYEDDKDTFILSGAEDLVPYLDPNGIHLFRTETWSNTNWKIFRYRPRTEGLHALIEFWKPVELNIRSQKSFWRIITKDNLTNIYGYSEKSKMGDFHKLESEIEYNTLKTFQWMLEMTYDAKGNYVKYIYDWDTANDFDFKSNIYEAHREVYHEQTKQRINRIWEVYPKYICYGNSLPLQELNLENILINRSITDELSSTHFAVVFDYGDHGNIDNNDNTYNITDTLVERSATWSKRPDSFSSYRAGFEQRTYRKCRRILMFHRFISNEQETNHGYQSNQHVLVRSTDLHYTLNQYNGMSMLQKVVQRGYRPISTKVSGEAYKSEEVWLRNGNDITELGVKSMIYAIKSFPPLLFKYSSFTPEKQRFVPMRADRGDMPSNALNNPNFALVDLFGTGLPDVIYTSPVGYFYWKNEGNGKFSVRRPLKTIPADLRLDVPGVGFGDMAGDGQADLLVHTGSLWGFYETNGKAGWQKFHPYKVHPSFSLNDPQTRLFDLNGDGKADAMTTKEDYFYYYPCEGENGFGKPKLIHRKKELSEFPNVDFSSPYVKLADMNGDGLNDIVLIHAGRIDYWANIGNGNFSRRITMEKPPKLDKELDIKFDPKRFFLVDIDGSGTADAIYVEADKVRFWFNKSGNGWSEELVIYGTPAVTDYSALVTADMFGNGTNGLLWTSDWPGVGQSNYRYLDFTGGSKPNLLIEMDNQMGSLTRIQYKPSTWFYLEDLKRKKRINWISTLPFPLQCVEKVERIDQLSGTKLVTSYAYHHGYYDGKVEREFRGFAYVEQMDTEFFDQFNKDSLHEIEVQEKIKNSEKGFYVPPVLTKTWYHTGVFNTDDLKDLSRRLKPLQDGGFIDLHGLFREDYYQGDTLAFQAEKCSLDLSNGIIDIHSTSEAYRVLRGSVLRQEVYGLDNSNLAEHPYSVSESSYKIQLLQNKGLNQHGVYQVHPFEKLSFHYERISNDPRIVQDLTLDTDEFGNVLKSLSIAYPRRNSIQGLEEQQLMYATYSLNKYINKNDENTFRFIGINYEAKQYELTGLVDYFHFNSENPRKILYNDIILLNFTYSQFHEQNTTGLNLRLLSWKQNFFKKSNLAASIDISAPGKRTFTNSLPLGEIDRVGLPYEQFTTVFQDTYFDSIFGVLIAPFDKNELLEKAGYIYRANTEQHWWVPTGQQAFDANNFYLPITSSDPWGNQITKKYDQFYLLPEVTTDPLGNKINVLNDYISLQPSVLRDPNFNGSKVSFDALGMVAASAVMGKLDEGFQSVGILEGDAMVNFTPLWDYDSIYHNYIDKPYEQNTIDLLQDAGSCMLYDLWRVLRKGISSPPVVYTAGRETHNDLNSIIQQKLMYFDGLGRELQTKIEAEPDPADRLKSSRWIASGWKIYNNKGKPVRQYEPFYTLSPEFEENIIAGCSSVLFYDPIDRVICTIHPNHTYEKVVFTPWEQHTWDTNDTVILDPRTDINVKGFTSDFLFDYHHCLDGRAFNTWKVENENSLDFSRQKAVNQTLKHANTPSTVYLDTMSRVFLTITRNGIDAQDEHKTRIKLDMQGNELSITDPREIVTFLNNHDMLQRKLLLESKDAGIKYLLPDVANKPLWSRDANFNNSLTQSDELRRPIELWVQPKAQGPFLLAQKTQYGEEMPGDSRFTNHRGKIWSIYDGAGLAENSSYDFKGNIIEAIRILSKYNKAQVFWDSKQNPLSATSNPDINLLLSTGFVSQYTFDALNRILSISLPDGTLKKPQYNKSNLLKTLMVNWYGINNSFKTQIFVNNIDYNAKGQRERIQYANGVTTKYSYELETYRLIRMLSTRQNGTDNLQDLNYTYDPVGNITFIEDKSINTIWCNNTAIDGINHYEYDPLYRLTLATGREHIGMTMEDSATIRFKKNHNIPLPPPCSNTNALRWYTETYHYDKSGNLEEKNHYTGQPDNLGNLPTTALWSTVQTYFQDNNRIHTSTTNGDTIIYDHDNNGNLLSLYDGMEWNYANQLVKVTKSISEIPGQQQDAFYQYDAQGNRIRKLITGKNAERIYLGDYEIYFENGGNRRDTYHIMDDKARIAMMDIEKTPSGNVQSDPVIRYKLNNHLGSSTLELDDTIQANIVTYEEYFPYGGTSFIAGTKNEADLKRYKYSGKEQDEETGLYYYGARYYAPWMGRWCSCDPIGNKDGNNIYLFVENNPIKNLDKKGYEGEESTSNSSNVCLPNSNTSNNEQTKEPFLNYKSEGLLDKSTMDYFKTFESSMSSKFAEINAWGGAETQFGKDLFAKMDRTLSKMSSDFLRFSKDADWLIHSGPSPDKLSWFSKNPLQQSYIYLAKRFESGASIMSKISRFSGSLNSGLNLVGAFSSGITQYSKSTCITPLFKLIDASSAFLFNYFIGKEPTVNYVALGDLGISYKSDEYKKLFGQNLGDYFNTSIRAFVSLAEAATLSFIYSPKDIPNETEGIENFHQNSMKGMYGDLFQNYSYAGEQISKKGVNGIMQDLLWQFKN